jgi:hypothetical protein
MREDIAALAGRIDVLTERVDAIEGRLDGLSGRVDGLASRLDRLESGQLEFSTRLDGLSEDMRQRFRIVNERLAMLA